MTLKKENKGYGGAPDSGNVKGDVSLRKIWAVLASRLTASASGCSSLACKGDPRPSPCSSYPSEAAGHRDQSGDTHGTPWTAWIGTVLQFWDSTSCLPWLCRLL